MHHPPAKPSSNDRPDADRQKGEAHISALLPWRRQLGNVIVVAWCLDDFAEREEAEGEHCSVHRGPEGHDQPRERRDDRAENDCLERGEFAHQNVDGQGEADNHSAVGNKNFLSGDIRVDIGLNVAGQDNVLLPENNPVSRKDYQEPHKLADSPEHQECQPDPDPPWDSEPVEIRSDSQDDPRKNCGQDQPIVAQHHAEITDHLKDRRRRSVAVFARLTEENQHKEEHGKDADRGETKNILNAEVIVYPSSGIRPRSAADVHHGVVDRIAYGAHAFLGSASGCPHHAWFYQRHAQSGENQDAPHKQAKGNGVADRREPRSADRTDQEVCRCQYQVGDRESAAKPQLVGYRTAENRHKPHHSAEEAGQRASLLGREVEFSLDVEGEGSEYAVVREALEDLADVRDPEGPLEARSYLLESLAKTHFSPGRKRSDCTEGRQGSKGLRQASPKTVFTWLIEYLRGDCRSRRGGPITRPCRDTRREHHPLALRACELRPRPRRPARPSRLRPRTRFLLRAIRPHSPSSRLRGWTIPVNLRIVRPSVLRVLPVHISRYPRFGFFHERVSLQRAWFFQRLSS